ncbi:MAG TPA: hypothetical protein VFV87_13210 [Pirellulaceae bacterium]|nr:hypothetical protein [Pirellulaceae bacterium]
MTTTAISEKILSETLARLETALLTPVIAGEFSGWVHSVQQASATLAVDLTSCLHTILHVRYREIVEADPEQSANVEKLMVGDEQLLEQLTRFHERLYALGNAAEHVDKNEGKLEQQRHKVEEEGIALILHVKKQQAASSTWLEEAFYRDRGVAD